MRGLTLLAEIHICETGKSTGSQAHVTNVECKFTFSQGDLPLMYSCVFWCEFIYLVVVWLYFVLWREWQGSQSQPKKRLNRWIRTKKHRNTPKVSLLYLFYRKKVKFADLSILQLNFSTRCTLGTEQLGRCRKVAVIERFKQESMYGLSAKNCGRCREVAYSGGKTVFLIQSQRWMVACNATPTLLWGS